MKTTITLTQRSTGGKAVLTFNRKLTPVQASQAVYVYLWEKLDGYREGITTALKDITANVEVK